ncbi:MAG: Rieske (2Fe-2S) protein [Dehalococcoidales bacterium]|nr:Rieske (2Fe-2S) protein [Dehalococcoidales bacterium]
MSFIEVAKTTEIPNGQMKSFSTAGKEILVTNYEGNYFAIDAKCTHMGGKLINGKLEGKIVTCPVHGARFDVTTGVSVSGPKLGPIKLKAKNLAIYEVKVDNKIIAININE